MDRRWPLALVVVLAGLAAALILRRVLATVFFAATVAYVLAPVENWYLRRGLPRWWAALATTLTGTGIAALVASPLFVLLYLRFDVLREFITGVPIPDEVTLSLLGVSRSVRVADLLPAVTNYLQSLAVAIVEAAPVVAIKATLFGMVVFALLIARDRLHDALRAVVPGEYHDAVDRLTDRAREVLFAIYVLQAATAIATFVISVPVFVVLGYEYPFTLATVAGFLQFLPIVGPSVLVLAVAAIDLALGNLVRAALVTAVGLVLIAWLPDPIVRPRLARQTADLPGSLYFVGFVGGLFTLGVVGVIAGPLVVALLSESVRMLAEEMQSSGDQTDLEQYGPPVAAADSPDTPGAADDADVTATDGAGTTEERPDADPVDAPGDPPESDADGSV